VTRNETVGVDAVRSLTAPGQGDGRHAIARETGPDAIVGNSASLRAVLLRADQVAPTGATVLLLGETGTGKSQLASTIHRRSRREHCPFLIVNCAALPATLIESELFGHERGAFTGAHAPRLGRFELADGGTLFLDEIGDLPLELQPKLLRILQYG
jgi:transcriptional regulator with GAF, ATPase, and Fis domain